MSIHNRKSSALLILLTVALAPTLCFSAGLVDLNNDRCVDKIWIESDSLYVGLNDCNAEFPWTMPYGVGADPVGYCTGDFDNDGDIDIAVANDSPVEVAVLLNWGNGFFADAEEYSFSWSWMSGKSICAGDFDLDGDQDLALLVAGGRFYVLTNNGAGSFDSYQFFVCPEDAYRVQAADFDGNSYPDIVTVSDVVAIQFNNGAGEFGDPGYFYTDIWDPSRLADFNGDSCADIALLGSKFGEIRVNDGTGELTGSIVLFSIGNCSGSCEYTSHVVADIDKDGDPDIISAFYGWDETMNPGHTGVGIRWNDGSGEMSYRDSCGITDTLLGCRYVGGCADLNGDGNLDLILDGFEVFYGSGDGRFSRLTQSSIAGENSPAGVKRVDLLK